MEQAAELVGHPSKDHAPRNTDYKRFVNDNNCTEEGEEASHRIRSLDTGSIQEEEKFDGFYAVCTNLEDDPLEVIAINEHRWHIEECFRVMKSEFKARPVYLSREDRIRVHFLTCFIALIIYRILEKKLGGKFSCREIVQTLQGMHMLFLREMDISPPIPGQISPMLCMKHSASGRIATSYQKEI